MSDSYWTVPHNNVKSHRVGWESMDKQLIIGPENIERKDPGVSQGKKKKSLLSHLSYHWAGKVATKAKFEEISVDDFEALPRSLESRNVSADYQRAQLQRESADPSVKQSLFGMLISLKKWALIRAFIYECLAEVCSQTIPIFVSLFLTKLDQINNLKPNDDSINELWKYGVLMCFLMFLGLLLHGFLYGRNLWITYKASLCTKIGLMGLIFEKSTRISASARQKFSLGISVALISASASKVDSAFPRLHFIVFSPLLTLTLITMIYYNLGTPALWTLALMVVAMPIQAIIMNWMSRARKVRAVFHLLTIRN
jgi:hypothetical protein